MNDHDKIIYDLSHDEYGRPLTAGEMAEYAEMMEDHLHNCNVCNRGFIPGPTDLWIPARHILNFNGQLLIQPAGPDDVPEAGFAIPMRPGKFPIFEEVGVN